MRYDPDHKKQTRDRIVRNAARKLRAEGLSGPGVASVMKASGLTVGGFYKHFRSKEELLADALALGFSEFYEIARSALRNVPHEEWWREIVRWYLSPEHCDHPATGCPVAQFPQRRIGGSQPGSTRIQRPGRGRRPARRTGGGEKTGGNRWRWS